MTDPLVVPWSDERAGRGVPVAELALHTVLLDDAATLMKRPRGRLIAVHEMSLTNGRPDVVIADISEQQFEHRREAGIQPLTAPAPLLVAQRMRRRKSTPWTVQSLMRELAQPRSRVMKALRELSRSKIVEIAADGQFGLSPAWRPASYQVVAVEAKLADWRRSVKQAQAIERYVDGVWLGFPDGYARRVPRTLPGLQRFGLVGITSDRALSVVRMPRGRRAIASYRSLTEEHLYARWLDVS